MTPNQPLKTDETLTPVQVEMMVRAAVRLPDLFAVAHRHLKVEHFDRAAEPHCRVLWQVVLNHVARYGVAALFAHPAAVRSALEGEAHAIVSRSNDELPAPLWPMLFSSDAKSPGLLPWVFGSPAEGCHLPQAREYLGRFLSDRAVQRPLRDRIAQASGRSIADLPAMLRESLALETSVRAVSANPIQSIAPAGWRPTPIAKVNTGIPFLDKMLDGGQAPGEVCGILGAYGSGKTMLAIQLACRAVGVQLDMADRAAALGQRYEPRHSYLFHYEAGTDEVRIRTWSHVCEIDWQRMMAMDPDALSSAAPGSPVPLQPYELARWKDQYQATGVIAGEKERLRRLDRYRDYVHIVDMSGPEEDPKRGTGYVPEIGQILATWAGANRHLVGTVIVDYAGVCAKRHLREHGLKEERLRHLVGDFGDECRRHIANPFRCSVWAMHQLAAAANKKSSATRQHYSDAAEGKNFAENLWFCFALGVPEPSTRCLRITCDKARRARLPAPASVLIDGQFSTLVDASDKFSWDEAQGRFVPTAEAARWAPPPTAAPTVDPYTGQKYDDVADSLSEPS